MTYKQHPLSAAFPAMNAEDFQALKDSIEAIGVQNPITLFDGMVIDGWNRYMAAQEVGMTCPTVELGDVDPRDFVLAQNKARRHITQAQLALATTAVYAWFPADGSAQKGGVAVTATPPKTNAELAAIAGVSEKTIRQAKVVQTKGAPEVVEAVKRGEIGNEKAAAIAKLPQDQQAAALTKPMPKAKPVAPAEEPPQPEDAGPDESELAANRAAEQADREALEKLLEADDKLATAVAEVKRLNHLNAQLQQRINGLMNEKAEAIKLCKSLQRKLDKLQKVEA